MAPCRVALAFVLAVAGCSSADDTAAAAPGATTDPGVGYTGPIGKGAYWLRLKMVRSGMQDWALFQLAADHGLAADARAEIARAYNQLGGCEWSGCNPPAWYWKTDYALMSEIRRNVAQALMQAGVH